MSNKEKFKGFKTEQLSLNEEACGEEIRGKYGDQVVETANSTFMQLTKDDSEQTKMLEQKIKQSLLKAAKTVKPQSDEAQKVVKRHKQWLCYFWPTYSKEAHAGLAHMYVSDERFKAYYDESEDGLVEFLKEAILTYVSKKD